MSRKLSCRGLLATTCLLASAAIYAGIEDMDPEDDYSSHRDAPGPEWKEQAVVIPSYPRAEDLIEVDLSLYEFPYALFIDSKSLSVGKDGVVRYTVVLRSANGVENVSYEGIRCRHSKVQRYAYGSGGEFRPVRNREWRFIRKDGQDRFRTELVNDYFCPLPLGDKERQILDKLNGRD
jgi:hypothetical protein